MVIPSSSKVFELRSMTVPSTVRRAFWPAVMSADVWFDIVSLPKRLFINALPSASVPSIVSSTPSICILLSAYVTVPPVTFRSSCSKLSKLSEVPRVLTLISVVVSPTVIFNFPFKKSVFLTCFEIKGL